MRVYDLKLGYSCNNRCIHCVIATDRDMLLDNARQIDSATNEIFDTMKSEEFRDADEVVLTGGEPTLRHDFLDIVKFIRYRYPKKYIVIQTNGKLLEQFVEEIFNMTTNIHYVIALHGFESLHNEIVRDKTNASYKATFSSVRKIQKLYGRIFNNVCTIKIVLSSKNISVIPDFCRYLYSENIKKIDIAYPHLNGFYDKSPQYAATVGISYKRVREIVPQLMELAWSYDYNFFLEEFPRCVFRDNKGNLASLPSNIRFTAPIMTNDISVKYQYECNPYNYNVNYMKMHSKTDACTHCHIRNHCAGIWDEANKLFSGEGLSSISSQEWDPIAPDI